MTIVDTGCAENSFSTLRHIRAVHNRSPFHADTINTSHSRRVTRKGGLFIVNLGGARFLLFEGMQIENMDDIGKKCAACGAF